MSIKIAALGTALALGACAATPFETLRAPSIVMFRRPKGTTPQRVPRRHLPAVARRPKDDVTYALTSWDGTDLGTCKGCELRNRPIKVAEKRGFAMFFYRHVALAK